MIQENLLVINYKILTWFINNISNKSEKEDDDKNEGQRLFYVFDQRKLHEAGVSE